MKILKIIFVTMLFGWYFPVHAQQPTTVLTFLPERGAVIYDLQTFTVKKGLQKIFVKNAPYASDFSSVLFLSHTPWVAIRSFGVLKSKVSFVTLLDAHLNQKVTVLCPSGQSFTGTLIEWNNRDVPRLYLQTSDRRIMIVHLTKDCSIRFEKQETLRSDDFYVHYFIDLQAQKAGQAKVAQIFKRDDDINYKMEYFGILGQDEKTMDLSAWFKFSNKSGISFKNTLFNIIVGKPQLMSRYEYWLHKEFLEHGTYFSEIPQIDTIKETQATEFKILEIKKPLNLYAGEALKRPYFKQRRVQVEKKYLLKFEPDMNTKLEAQLIISNTRKNGLGRILPQGTFTIFKEKDGKPIFLSQTQIENVTANDKIRLALGEVIDVEAEKYSIQYLKIKGDSVQVTWDIYVNNLKDKPIRLEVLDNCFDGKFLDVIKAPSKIKHTRKGIKYTLEVPARQEKTYKLITLEEFSKYGY